MAHAILEGVLSTAQDLIKEKGQVNVSADAKPIEEGGEPPLQAIYIVSIDYPQPLASKLVDPFRPIEEPRLVHVKVHIPFLANDPLKDVHQSFVDRLKVLPVPEYLHGFLHGDHLFIDAVEVQSVTLPEVAYYVNKNNLDASGRSQPIQEEVKVKMHEVTFKCQIFGGSAAAAISAPAPVSTPAGNDKADKAKAKEAGK